jgi:hypothetical protein
MGSDISKYGVGLASLISLWIGRSKTLIGLIAILLIASTENGFGQAVWQSSATAIGTSNTATANKPSGTVEGDLLIASLTFESGINATITPPTGWIQILRTEQTGNVGIITFYKIAGSSEGATYTFGGASSNNLAGKKWSLGISRISGASAISPFALVTAATGSSGNVVAPSITTQFSNQLVLAFYTNKKGATYTAASGTVKRYDAPNTSGGIPSNMMASYVQATAGATGTKTATPSETAEWAAQQIVINPILEVEVLTSGSSYTVPTGVTSLMVEAWGGGGRGSTRTSSGGGGGGGGGAYSASVLSVNSNSSISYSVGTGSSSTSAGGDSWFVSSTTLLAKGGNSVANNNTNGVTGGQSTSGIGQVTFNGGNGANATSTRGGGGGSSAGSSQNGNNASGRTGGTAPTDGGAGGTAPDNGNLDGQAGSFPGGGGSGSARTSGTRTGGSGANGQIRISYEASIFVTSPSDIFTGTRAEYTITRNGPTTAAATVNLSSSGATGGQFFAAAAGGSAITSISIPVGSTSVKVYFSGNAGTHSVNFSSSGYLAASDELVIIQPASTVTVKSGTISSFTFTGSEQGPGVTDFDFTGSTGTKSVLYTGTGGTAYNSSIAPTNAGTYQVVASVDADANFASGSSTSFDFTITAASITITPDAGQSKSVGDPEPVITFQSSGWLGSDNSTLLQGALSRAVGEEVGFYPITLGNLTETSGNYLLALTAGVQFEIKPASTVTIKSGTSDSYTFTGSAQGPGINDFTFTGSTGTKTILYSGTGSTVYNSATPPTNAGTYQVVASVAADASFLGASSEPFAFTISKANSTITATGTTTFTYTGSPQGPGTSTVSGSTGAVTYSYSGTGSTTYTVSATRPTNAGTYQVVASVAEDANFGSANSVPFAFTISRANVTITPTAGQSKSVGDPEPVLTFQSSGWLGSDNSTLLQGALSRAVGEEVGFYPITLGSLTETSGNYLLALTAEVQFEIKPTSTVTIKSGTSDSYTFTNSAQGPGINDFTFTGSTGDKTILYSGTGSTVYNSATPPTNAGTYQVVASVVADANFGSANSLPFAFTITRATVIITPDSGQSKFIGDPEPVLTFQSSGWLGSDNSTLLQGALSRAVGEEVGFYPITLGSLTETSGNYLLALTAGVQFEIKPASTVTIKSGTSDSYTFTNSAQGPGINDFTFTGSTGDKTILYSGTGGTVYNSATPPTNAGTYQVVASVVADANFGSANSLPFAFTITRATVTITPDSGQSKFIGEVDPVFSFQSTGWIAPDNSSLLGGTLSRTAGETLGTYPITLGSLTETSGNYLLALTAGVQFEIKIDPSMPVVEGTATFENSAETSSHSVTLPSNIQQGDLLVMVLRPGSGRTVTTPTDWTQLTSRSSSGVSYVLYRTASGTESTTQSISLSGSGRLAVITYRISNWEGTPEAAVADSNVNDPPSITTSWDASPTLFIAAMTNRKSDSDVTGAPDSFSSLVSVANSSSSNNTRVRASTAVRAENTKTIDPGAFITEGDINNPHSFTIAIKGKRKVLTVVANPISKVYGQVDPELTYTVTGFQGTDNESILTGSLTRTAGQNVGTYTITQGNLAAADYIIEFTSADFSITPKTLSITPDSGQFKIVGESDPESLTFQASGFEFSDNNALLTGSLVRAEGESPGFYPITQGTLNETSRNYTIQFTNGIQFEIRSNPSQYIVSASTTNPKFGTTITITAQLADENGSAIPEAGRTVTWSELIGTSGTFSSATSVSDTQGIATVQFTTSSTVGISTKITASGTGGLFGTSPEITTVDVAPTQLVFVQDPSGSTTVAGQAFATQPIVHILDAEGNLVSSATKEVTLSLFEGTGELRGNINLNAVNGIATFAGLNIDLAGSDKEIIAESEGLSSATTSAFTITPAPASLFTKYAGDQQVAQVGTAVDIAPAVRIQDIFGNPIPGVSVSFSVSSGGGSIQPTTVMLTDSEGIASLTSWTLGSSQGQNSLTASASGFSNLTFTALASEDEQVSEFPNNTWTVPPGVTEITVEAWGAGGGGGGVREGNNRIGAGGGGGAYVKHSLTVTPNQVLNISIGTGGTAGTSSANGANGGDSRVSFNSSDLVRAKGGIGGQSRTSSISNPQGGAGGSANESIGDTRIVGGNGLNGSGTGGSTGAGGNGANGGTGGAARTNAGTGNQGTPPGGGGGGGRDNDNNNRTGGAGGSGKIIITFPKPVNQFRAATSGNWEDADTWEQQFSNGQFAKIDTKPEASSSVIISEENIKVTVSNDLSISGSITVTSNGELVLASDKILTMNSGSSLTIGNEGILSLPAAGVISGAGNVAINKGATLAIAHPEGIKTSGTTGGAIQNTGTRAFSSEANYLYNGTTNQVIGSGLPAVVYGLVINNPTTVTLDRPLEVAVDLEVITGTLELDATLTVDLNMALNGSSSILIKEGKTLQAELLSNISTNNISRIILQPGAKYFNLGISTPRLEVRQNLTGTRGWRMMGAPVRETTYQSFLSGLESQGFPGSTRPNLQPNVLWWDETDAGTTAQGWRQPSNISQEVSSGRGHYVFVFGGAKLPGGSSESYSDVLPLTLATTGQELNLNSGGFEFDISFTQRNNQLTSQNNNFTEVSIADEGFNLISNPTASYIDFHKASGWQKTNIDQTIYIWNQNKNNGNGAFELFQGNESDNLIAPYQAFWIKANAPNPVLVMNNEAKSFETSSFFGRILEKSPKAEPLKIKLNVFGSKMEAETILRFSPEGKDEKDEWDAYQLESLSNSWLSLFTYGSPKEKIPLAINHLSLPEGTEEKSIPLNLAAAWEGKATNYDYLLKWELPADWPSNLRVVLMDHISEKAIDMADVSEYRFKFEAPTSYNANLRIESNGMKIPEAVIFSSPYESGNPNARINSNSPKRPFTIVVGYQGSGIEPEYRPELPKLFTPYPNPFVDRTRIKFYLPMTAKAEIKILDSNGKMVGKFDPAEYLSGIHELDWIPSANKLSAGMYFIQLITQDHIITQKLLKK